jgi:hypothetical protein
MEMPTAYTALSLGSFPGDSPPAIAWPQFQTQLLHMFVRCYPSREYGHIDALIPIQEIRARFEQAEDFQMSTLIKHPGEQPSDPTLFSSWEKTMSMYNYQQLTRTRAIDTFYGALDAARLRLVDPENKGPTFFKPAKAYEILQSEYGTLSRENRQVLMKALREKFRPAEQDPLTVLAEHDKIYARLKAGKAKRNQCDMIDDFMETFIPCGLFQRVIEKFLEEHPDAEDQKYSALVDILKQHLKTHSVVATTGSAGYAGLSERLPQPNMTPSTASTSTADMEARIMSNITALIEAQQYALLSTIAQSQPVQPAPNSRNKQRTGQKPNRPTRSNKTAKQYCHTHGLVYHNSADCKTPGPHHDHAATFDNRKGGSDHNC